MTPDWFHRITQYSTKRALDEEQKKAKNAEIRPSDLRPGIKTTLRKRRRARGEMGLNSRARVRHAENAPESVIRGTSGSCPHYPESSS